MRGETFVTRKIAVALRHCLIDGSGLNHGDLVLTQRLANNFEPIRQGRVAEGAFRLASSSGSDRRGERFFRVDEVRLRLGQGCSQSGKGFTGAMHGPPPCQRNAVN